MVNKFSKIKDRVVQFAEYKRVVKEDFFQKIGSTSANFRGDAKNTPLNSSVIENIFTEFPDLSLEWLITGNGDMLKDNSFHSNSISGTVGIIHGNNNKVKDVVIGNSSTIEKENRDTKKRNLIPLYSDVSSIGGINALAADMSGQSSPTEWIDAGDWFIEATAAIRHYGDSMEEYPNGCILALKEILNMQLLIWGRDYVIETDEYRITKRIQKSTSSDHITAYSSNRETYPDGRLIHEPIDIPIESIRKIALVLGYVVKKYSSGMVYTVKKNK